MFSSTPSAYPAAAPPQQWQQPGYPPQLPQTQPPTRSSGLKWVLFAVLAVVILGVGGCVALVFAARSEVSENEATVVEDEAVAPGVTTGTVPAGEGENPGPEPGASGAAGTRESPLPIGTEVDLGNGWRITIVAADVGPDATATVVAANEFNEPPSDGKRYIVIDIAAAFDGSDDAATETPFFGFDLSVFGSDNVERSSTDTFAVAPEPVLDLMSELAAGGVATGNIVMEVGADETGLVARLEPSMSFDETEAWIALG